MSTRTRAQERIRDGQVSVDGEVVLKAGFLIEASQRIELHGVELAFVSRGGLKLATALDHWMIQLSGRHCLDVGISTGGFTDCMLQRGACGVIGIDSGHGQLAARLQNDPRLQLFERTNARHLSAALLPDGINFFAMDVSFIAASLVLPAVIAAAFRSPAPDPAIPMKEAVVLVKPQYEAGREFVGKHGLVRSEAAHLLAIQRVRETVCSHGARKTQVIESPIVGGDGNREFLLYAQF